MKTFFLEAYGGGSHQQFALSLLENLKEKLKCEYFALPPHQWRWRLQGSHFALANYANDHCDDGDIVILTSLTDSAAFKGLLKKKVTLIQYMHESQMTYPLEPHSSGHHNQKMIQKEVAPLHHLNQVLAADQVVFNSEFNKRSTLNSLLTFCRKRGESVLARKCENLSKDWSVIPVGIDSNDERNQNPNPGRNIDLLWNHRWDYDKNPQGFTELIQAISKEKNDLKVALLGGEKENSPFHSLEPSLISLRGHLPRKEYLSTLKQCSLLPVTSFHDFQGIGLLEAMEAGVVPLLPRRMVYPEILPSQEHAKLFYDSPEELKKKVSHFLNDGVSEGLRAGLRQRARDFHWDRLMPRWENLLQKISS